jgi:hypothetical protein
MQTKSLFRLGGSQPGWSCSQQGEQVPLGHIPKTVERRVWFGQLQPPV